MTTIRNPANLTIGSHVPPPPFSPPPPVRDRDRPKLRKTVTLAVSLHQSTAYVGVGILPARFDKYVEARFNVTVRSLEVSITPAASDCVRFRLEDGMRRGWGLAFDPSTAMYVVGPTHQIKARGLSPFKTVHYRTNFRNSDWACTRFGA